MAQLGVFLIPPPDHPFYVLCSDILGYDIRSGRRSTSSLAAHLGEETASRWLGPASVFGIHCTIGGAALSFDDADLGEIQDRLAWIASRTAPFRLVNGQILGEFRANPHSLLAGFDSPDGAIHRLHRQVVTTVSPLYTTSRYAPWLPRLGERERGLYIRTGEPWTLELFVPHWTLASSLPDWPTWETVRDLVTGPLGLFADERTRTLDVTDVHLVERPDDGFCTILGSFPLTGAR